jgi:hypothetical protein
MFSPSDLLQTDKTKAMLIDRLAVLQEKDAGGAFVCCRSASSPVRTAWPPRCASGGSRSTRSTDRARLLPQQMPGDDHAHDPVGAFENLMHPQRERPGSP